MLKCPICKREVDGLKTAIKNNEYLSERCERCINSFTSSAIYARRHDREWDKRQHNKDLIQRYNGTEINEDFVRAYPDVAANQWGPNVLRDYGQNRKLL